MDTGTRITVYLVVAAVQGQHEITQHNGQLSVRAETNYVSHENDKLTTIYMYTSTYIQIYLFLVFDLIL